MQFGITVLILDVPIYDRTGSSKEKKSKAIEMLKIYLRELIDY